MGQIYSGQGSARVAAGLSDHASARRGVPDEPPDVIESWGLWHYLAVLLVLSCALGIVLEITALDAQRWNPASTSWRYVGHDR
jgi:hypothetical protein